MAGRRRKYPPHLQPVPTKKQVERQLKELKGLLDRTPLVPSPPGIDPMTGEDDGAVWHSVDAGLPTAHEATHMYGCVCEVWPPKDFPTGPWSWVVRDSSGETKTGQSYSMWGARYLAVVATAKNWGNESRASIEPPPPGSPL